MPVERKCVKSIQCIYEDRPVVRYVALDGQTVDLEIPNLRNHLLLCEQFIHNYALHKHRTGL